MEGILYKKDSKSRIRMWSIETVGNKIVVIYGLMPNGKKVCKEETILQGKNIGKKNETSPEAQAILEATSTYQHQKDKGYFETILEAQLVQVYLPMLAHTFSKRKHNIIYPAWAQRKLNGVRCLAQKLSETEINFMSRGGKPWTVLQQHFLKQTLLKIMKIGDVFDGEIYKHGWSLQRIVSAVKKRNSDTDKLEYWVYDRAMEGTFEDRFLLSLVTTGLQSLKVVGCYLIQNENQVYELHDQFVKEGYEGIIIRNSSGLYKFGHRSKDLQKHKNFIDEEFEIIGFYSELNKTNGVAYQCIMYSCKTKDGGEFGVRPIGKFEERQIKYEEAVKTNDCVGKMLTVRYFELTDDTQGKGKKVPEFPSGRVIRDYE